MLVQLFTGLLAVGIVAAQADSEVVAVMLLGRHGDRTAKTGPGVEGNSVLTTLGKNKVFQTGMYFRRRYLDSSSPNFIQGVDTNYLYNQLYASAPYFPMRHF
jgi:hypothetical protein